MKILMNAALILTLASVLSCGKKATESENTSLSVVITPLSGTWSGTGTQTLDGGAPQACQSASVTFSFTEKQATMSNLSTTCGSTNVTSDPLVLDMVGGVLSYAGATAGTITDQAIHISLTDSGTTYDATFTLTDATHMTYSENISDGVHTLATSATLTH